MHVQLEFQFDYLKNELYSTYVIRYNITWDILRFINREAKDVRLLAVLQDYNRTNQTIKIVFLFVVLYSYAFYKLVYDRYSYKV